MSDLLNPEKEANFVLKQFKSKRYLSGTFFNALVNLNKFVAFEQRDPFAYRNELTENIGFSEWDRFAKSE